MKWINSIIIITCSFQPLMIFDLTFLEFHYFWRKCDPELTAFKRKLLLRNGSSKLEIKTLKMKNSRNGKFYGQKNFSGIK